MGLPWVRLDTNIFNHPKLLALREDNQHRAIVLHLEAMCYSAEYDLGGFIPASCLTMLTACSTDATAHAQDDARTLLDACLWVPAPGGFSMHGWENRQQANEQRRKRAQKAAAARWAIRNGHLSDAQ